MVTVEELKKQLRVEEAKQNLENVKRRKSIEKKTLKKKLRHLKRRKLRSVIKKVIPTKERIARIRKGSKSLAPSFKYIKGVGKNIRRMKI